jgi:hypothetical protein
MSIMTSGVESFMYIIAGVISSSYNFCRRHSVFNFGTKIVSLTVQSDLFLIWWRRSILSKY